MTKSYWVPHRLARAGSMELVAEIEKLAGLAEALEDEESVDLDETMRLRKDIREVAERSGAAFIEAVLGAVREGRVTQTAAVELFRLAGEELGASGEKAWEAARSALDGVSPRLRYGLLALMREVNEEKTRQILQERAWSDPDAVLRTLILGMLE